MLLLGREQVEGPLDRRPKSLVARLRVATAPQQIETPGEALEDLPR